MKVVFPENYLFQPYAVNKYGAVQITDEFALLGGALENPLVRTVFPRYGEYQTSPVLKYLREHRETKGIKNEGRKFKVTGHYKVGGKKYLYDVVTSLDDLAEQVKSNTVPEEDQILISISSAASDAVSGVATGLSSAATGLSSAASGALSATTATLSGIISGIKQVKSSAGGTINQFVEKIKQESNNLNTQSKKEYSEYNMVMESPFLSQEAKDFYSNSKKIVDFYIIQDDGDDEGTPVIKEDKKIIIPDFNKNEVEKNYYTKILKKNNNVSTGIDLKKKLGFDVGNITNKLTEIKQKIPPNNGAIEIAYNLDGDENTLLMKRGSSPYFLEFYKNGKLFFRIGTTKKNELFAFTANGNEQKNTLFDSSLTTIFDAMTGSPYDVEISPLENLINLLSHLEIEDE